MTLNVNDLVQVKYGHMLEAYAFSEVHGLDNDLLGVWSKSLYEYLHGKFPNIERDTNYYLRDEDENGNDVTRLYDFFCDEDMPDCDKPQKNGDNKLRFSLSYKGRLNTNGKKEHKHYLRRYFSKQIKKIWEFEIGKLCGMQVETMEYAHKNILHQIGDYFFIPIVSPTYNLTAEIDITILKNMELGSVISSSGDIDNSLKTLFDAFQVPDKNQMEGIEPPLCDEEKYIYCLIEDDCLITKVSARAAKLLEDGVSQNDVVMIANIDIIRNDKIFDDLNRDRMYEK